MQFIIRMYTYVRTSVVGILQTQTDAKRSGSGGAPHPPLFPRAQQRSRPRVIAAVLGISNASILLPLVDRPSVQPAPTNCTAQNRGAETEPPSTGTYRPERREFGDCSFVWGRAKGGRVRGGLLPESAEGAYCPTPTPPFQTIPSLPYPISSLLCLRI